MISLLHVHMHFTTSTLQIMPQNYHPTSYRYRCHVLSTSSLLGIFNDESHCKFRYRRRLSSLLIFVDPSAIAVNRETNSKQEIRLSGYHSYRCLPPGLAGISQKDSLKQWNITSSSLHAVCCIIESYLIHRMMFLSKLSLWASESFNLYPKVSRPP